MIYNTELKPMNYKLNPEHGYTCAWLVCRMIFYYKYIVESIEVRNKEEIYYPKNEKTVWVENLLKSILKDIKFRHLQRFIQKEKIDYKDFKDINSFFSFVLFTYIYKQYRLENLYTDLVFVTHLKIKNEKRKTNYFRC